MAQIAKMVGGAGTGKTTWLLSTMEKVIETGLGMQEIGFVSFTRAARAEAAERAARRFNCPVKTLINDGWFRTLHSVAYKCVGVDRGALLTDDADSKKWFKEALGITVSGGQRGHDSDLEDLGGKTRLEIALGIWHVARLKLTSYDNSYSDLRMSFMDGAPSLEQCRAWVSRYEQRKTLDHKLDFTDLIGAFAGVRFRLEGEHERCRPAGGTPDVPVWFFDEQQDTSALLDLCCERLVTCDACRWAYFVADPFQAIYQFAGADSHIFLSREAHKSGVMPKSYRCPPVIMQLGERILQRTSTYYDRQIQPADHEGEIIRRNLLNDVRTYKPHPSESWLFIARTNFQARRLMAWLNKANLPWQGSNDLKSHWQAPKRNMAIGGLLDLERGYPIGYDEWMAALGPKMLPAKYCGEDLLTRGTKAAWDVKGFKPPELVRNIEQLGEWGATPRLMEMIKDGSWRCLIKDADKYAAAIAAYGQDLTGNSNIRVGTIHSAKGAEADNVVLLTTTSTIVERSQQTQDGKDSENYLAYVAVTRARKRLIVIEEPRERCRMRIF